MRGSITVTALICAVLVAACSSDLGDNDLGTTSTPQVVQSTVANGVRSNPVFTVDIPEAISVNLASNGKDPVAVAWITPANVNVGRLDVAAQVLADVIEANGDVVPIAHPIERPAVALGEDGSIDLAFTSFQGAGGSVFLTRIDDSPHAPLLISGESQPETNLVHMTLQPSGTPLLSWLENSTLSVAYSESGEVVEVSEVDGLTCDCCNPVPLFLADDLVVAYRDLDRVDGEVLRDVAVVRSVDGGRTFEQPQVIADEHWSINGCPFTGPSTVHVDGALVVAWMDARQVIHPDQTTSSIWVDVSRDNGATFGVDLEITREGVNRWPVMAVDDRETIHLVWERRGSDGGLMYSYSDDQGASFAEPRTLVAAEDSAGSPKSPSVLYQDGLLVVSWTDGTGGHVSAWPVD